MKNGFEHLRLADPLLAPVLERFGVLDEPPARRAEGHFEALARIVVGQQLSAKVAQVIWLRVHGFFEGQVTAEKLTGVSVEQLKSLGLSGAKARYLHNLAEHQSSGLLLIDRFDEMPDEEIIREITAIKGFGPWSADMFLMFHLMRPDVMPVGDLGIREAVKRIYNLPERPAAAQLLEISERWRPHRTLVCRYLWRSLDNEPAVTTTPVQPN